MQKITIEEIIVPTLIGVYDWERERKTNLLVTVQIWSDLSKAMVSDDVKDTLDYAVIAQIIKETAADTSFELLESLGKVLCDKLMAMFVIEKLCLDIEKPGILPDAKRVVVGFAYDSSGPITA